MANVSITDNFGLNADLALRDDSALGKAGLTKIICTAKELFTEFDQPVDKAILRRFQFGVTGTSPNLLNDELPSLTLATNINSELTIKTSKDKLLFDADDDDPVKIPIQPNEAWVGLELDATVKASAAATFNTVGVALEGDAKLSFSTYVRVTSAQPPLPKLGEACVALFNSFSPVTSAKAIRALPPGVLSETEASGSITASVTLQQPFDINALASADLPLAGKVSVQPEVKLQLGGSLSIAGDLLVRCYKQSANEILLGVYVQSSATLSVSFTAQAGIGGSIGDSDVLSALLNAALPQLDVSATGLSADDAAALNKVVKDALDRSLSVQLTGMASTGNSHEAAVLYAIDLSNGDATQTDEALRKALTGDWRGLDTLPNARRQKDLVSQTAEKKLSLTLNLFGLYSATSAADYVRNCTLKRDYDTNQLTLIDKVEGSRITVAVQPFAADTDKLRHALMEDFLSTLTYAAALGGKLSFDMVVKQSYLDYQQNMSWDDMFQNIRLGYALGVIPSGSLDALLRSSHSFAHVCVAVTVAYTSDQALGFFFSDVATRTPRTQEELDKIGRNTMMGLLNPADSGEQQRIGILNSDGLWARMTAAGPAMFYTIPALSHMDSATLDVIAGDYIAIRWWSDALTKVAPALKSVLDALDSASGTDPLNDPDFRAQHDNLPKVLGGVTRNLHAAFVHSWGENVMFALSGKHGAVSMDLVVNGTQQHYSN